MVSAEKQSHRTSLELIVFVSIIIDMRWLSTVMNIKTIILRVSDNNVSKFVLNIMQRITLRGVMIREGQARKSRP